MMLDFVFVCDWEQKWNDFVEAKSLPSCRPLPGPNVTPEPNEKNQGSGRQLFQAHKTSHKTPFKSGKHPGTA